MAYEANIVITNHGNIKSHIYYTLRDRICLRIYKRGMILKEEELASEFNVSRTPIREAIQLLRLDGLVESKKRVGTTVIGIDKARMQEIYAVRIMLIDNLAIESNRSFNSSNIEVMDRLLDKIDGLFSGNDPGLFWHINEQLHENLISVVQNQFLRQLTRTLFLQTARSWAFLLPFNWDESCNILKDEVQLERKFMLDGSRAGVFSAFKSYAILSKDNCDKMYSLYPDVP